MVCQISNFFFFLFFSCLKMFSTVSTGVGLPETFIPGGTMHVYRDVHSDEKLPLPSGPGAVGYDVWVIDEHERLSQEYPENVVAFRTGLRVLPPRGYHLELLPRSSLAKHGWGLANSIGLIDPDYTGELIVLLLKQSPGARAQCSDGNPWKVGQLVLRRTYHVEYLTEHGQLPTFMERVALLGGTTARGAAGFGSTD